MSSIELNNPKFFCIANELKNKVLAKNFFDFDMVLESQLVRLRPLVPSDRESLASLALGEDIWAYFAIKMSNQESISNYIEEALQQRASKLRYTFVIEDPINSAILGSTAFGNFSKNDSRIEIGWSWLGRRFHGTGFNAHAKFLLLSFAFDFIDLERAEAKTDVLNVRARKGLLKVGMTEEGILRSHTLMPDGRRRDTIFYSILKNEWPSIRERVFKDYEFNISLR